jgi:hypothetical protein
MTSNLIVPALASLAVMGMVAAFNAAHVTPACRRAPTAVTHVSNISRGVTPRALPSRFAEVARDVCGAEPADRAAYGAQYDACVSSVSRHVAAALSAQPPAA